MSKKNMVDDIYIKLWKKTKVFSEKQGEPVEDNDLLRNKPSDTSSKISIKPISELKLKAIWEKPKTQVVQKKSPTEIYEETTFLKTDDTKEPYTLKESERDNTYILELEVKNKELQQENQNLRNEVNKSVELLNQMDVSFKQNIRQKNKALKDKRFYANEYNKLESRFEELKNTHEQLFEENEMLREEREEKLRQMRNLEMEIDDLEIINKNFKEKIKKYKKLSKNEEERQILTSESILEAERLRKENDDLKFKLGQLKQQLALEKAGIDTDEVGLGELSYDEKLIAEINALENQVQKLEEQLEIKDIEYGAKVQIYKKALLKKGDSEDIIKKEELKLELKENKKLLREQELIIEELENKLKALSQDSAQATDYSTSTLSKRIIKLETLLNERNFKIKNLTSMVDNLEKQLTDAVEKIAKLEEELISRPDREEKSEVDVEQLNMILNKVSRMKTPKSVLEKRIEEYGQKLKELHRENGILNAQLEQLYSKLGDLNELKA